MQHNRYGVVGMSLFGDVENNTYITDQANFRSFPRSVLVLFRMVTGRFGRLRALCLWHLSASVRSALSSVWLCGLLLFQAKAGTALCTIASLRATWCPN